MKVYENHNQAKISKVQSKLELCEKLGEDLALDIEDGRFFDVMNRMEQHSVGADSSKVVLVGSPVDCVNNAGKLDQNLVRMRFERSRKACKRYLAKVSVIKANRKMRRALQA